MRRIGLAVVLRLTFGLVLAILSVASDSVAQQTGPRYRVGVLTPAGRGISNPLEAFRQGLRELGYEEGRNLAIEWRFAQGRNDRLQALAGELAQAKVNVIFAINTPAALAAKNFAETIPIVVTRVSDPVGAGLVASLARPGGNITGISTMSDEVSGKRIELLKEALPGLRTVAILWNSANIGHAASIKEMELAGPRLGLQIRVFGIRRPEELPGSLQAITTARAEALLVIDDLVIGSLQTPILEAASRHKFPVASQFREFVEAGGLMAYAPNNDEMFRRAAFFVDKILKGAKPADMPVQQATKFEFVINRKTAKALGLDIPLMLMVSATELID